MGLEGLVAGPTEGLDGDLEGAEGVDAPDAEEPPAGFPVDEPLFGPEGPEGLLGELFCDAPLLPPPTPEAGPEGWLEVALEGPLFGPKGPPGPPPEGLELVGFPPMVVPVVLPEVTAKDGMPRGPRLMVPSVSTRSISISASFA